MRWRVKYAKGVAFKGEAGMSQSKNHIKEAAGPHARLLSVTKREITVKLFETEKTGMNVFTPLNEACCSTVVPESRNLSWLKAFQNLH